MGVSREAVTLAGVSACDSACPVPALFAGTPQPLHVAFGASGMGRPTQAAHRRAWWHVAVVQVDSVP